MAQALKIYMVEGRTRPALFVSKHKSKPMIVNSFFYGKDQLSVDDMLWPDEPDDPLEGWELLGAHCT